MHLVDLYRDIRTLAVLLVSCQHCPNKARAQAAGKHASVYLNTFIRLTGTCFCFEQTAQLLSCLALDFTCDQLVRHAHAQVFRNLS